MINNTNSVEILAPCGSYDILIAAVKAGASACYIGGNKFGARAYATNLNNDSLLKAIDYAHIHNVKLYLTVNTLLKENEINDLYDYLSPYYEAGIDAVIVQDLGVFDFVKNTFPDLPIHCSTQMNITSFHGAELMKQKGASRIVTAREMSLEAIKAIRKNVDIEIESFVHGAMCYSYSGQCLMSSLAGGRSGNRGRCAQPCRKCYSDSYILSMKDMCTLELIPDLIEAGISSLKIEGRMKNEYYVASAVNAYKELVDDYYNGTFDVEKAKRLKYKLASIYNRGGFCDSYYFVHNGPEMISANRPNNQGVLVGKLTEISNGAVSLKLYEDVFKQDVLEFATTNGDSIDVTTGVSGKKGDIIRINAPKTRYIKPEQDIYRTRCNHYIEEITENILEKEVKVPIKGYFVGHIGDKIKLILSHRDTYVELISDILVEESQKAAVDTSSIKEKLTMLGDTEFVFEALEVDVDDRAFIPMGQIKKLRREGIDSLREKLLGRFRRSKALVPSVAVNTKKEYNNILNNSYIVKVSNVAQLKKVLAYSPDIVILGKSLYENACSSGVIDQKVEAIKYIIELPNIINQDFNVDGYLLDKTAGVFVKNIDGYASVLKNYSLFKDSIVIAGSTLYAYNNLARKFLQENIPNLVFELPKELNLTELTTLNQDNSIITEYEYQQVMLSAQCVTKNKKGCSKCDNVEKIVDDKSNLFFAKAICEECCNIIYNGIPTNIIGKRQEIYKKISPSVCSMLTFTIEDEEQVKNIMDGYLKKTISDGRYTTGHYFRGVE